ncbi:MAG: hypothetical protein JXB08_05050 [Bacilli bacterium]|nr:hypothetical protein [Bacilli bacterium]MBN2877452.1 hypothetical protein [Bacilli bacterium]
MILEVKSRKELKRFIYYVKDLYKDDPHYIYPLFSILTKELVREVLQQRNYKAILSLDESSKIQGRLLYRMEFNEKAKRDTCYFSYFDCVNSQLVANELFDYMETDMKQHNVTYSEGSFTPYDPDNRRGILIDGFDSDPIIFTSYNKAYYQSLIEQYGYQKVHDTFSVKPVITDANIKRLQTLGKYFERKYEIDVDYVDFKDMEKEIAEIHQVLSDADNDHIYQEVPSVELIRSVAVDLKSFLDKRIIRIARERSTGRPIGFCFCLLDYNQVFKLTKGRLNPLKLLFARKYITRVRGMMQYVIPEYQGTGVIGYIYHKIFAEFKDMGITEFEGGTMMEGNDKPLHTFDKFGGKINKTYRIYGKDLHHD